MVTEVGILYAACIIICRGGFGKPAITLRRSGRDSLKIMVAEEWGLQIRVVEGSREGSKNKD
jgi:hypothetical protein